MKSKTETILLVLKYLALIAGISYSILCGSQLLTFVASFIDLQWSSRTYQVDLNLFKIREQSVLFYSLAMVLNILVLAIKAFIWYVIYDLLLKLKMKSPFSIEVEKKLEKIAYLSLTVWLVCNFFWNIYTHYLTESTGILLPVNSNGNEYFFIAGIVYIVSQIFKRGIEIQEENQLTV